ncbi:MAG TPA: outer membrane protein [Bradyrhizobium sp.]|uniref:outer membrane protein n=1 Tax=Bradyrhizobium sp. TaxID=376 RepID=UPI002CA87B18|nr:outer membrane protein [Bradyrhizobium sp.]HLZ05160.1 outer membrane protein [Bradyrhizobium sp.]
MRKLIAAAFISNLAALAFAAPGFAADLPAREYAKSPAVVPPVPYYDWSGFYIGVNVGGSWGHGRSTSTALDGTFVSSGSRDDSAVIGGGQVGYNVMVAPHVLLGVEADVDASSARSTVTSPDGSNSFASKLDDFGTVRGRVGFTQDNWLFYGTGGFAWSQGSVTRTQIAAVTAVPPIPAAAGTVETASTTRTGWAAGAGVEWGITPNWTARVEYLYLDLGTATSVFPLANRQVTSSSTMSIARIGVNYKFGGPVVARY